jgi:heme/copper-type cytochrome/quinol oxidase subunit 2
VVLLIVVYATFGTVICMYFYLLTYLRKQENTKKHEGKQHSNKTQVSIKTHITVPKLA